MNSTFLVSKHQNNIFVEELNSPKELQKLNQKEIFVYFKAYFGWREWILILHKIFPQEFVSSKNVDRSAGVVVQQVKPLLWCYHPMMSCLFEFLVLCFQTSILLMHLGKQWNMEKMHKPLLSARWEVGQVSRLLVSTTDILEWSGWWTFKLPLLPLSIHTSSLSVSPSL